MTDTVGRGMTAIATAATMAAIIAATAIMIGTAAPIDGSAWASAFADRVQIVQTALGVAADLPEHLLVAEADRIAA